MSATQYDADQLDPRRSTGVGEDAQLVAALRSGEETAFATLLDRYHTSMLRLATIYVQDHSVAEEVVQEAWLGVLQGIQRFEGRASLKTWIFRILTNIAKTRGAREGRTVPFSAAWTQHSEPFEPAVAPERFQVDTAEPGHWVSMPRSWAEIPEERFLSDEACDFIRKAIDLLPPSQREVITLRDVEQWSGDEVCNVLGITETNQRVLLHRARSKVRRALEEYLDRE
jgi:RNA polymerase sigma-70 factor, ECF subfamily